jgi:manganese/zinc/iron transport system permease protein
MIVIAGGIVFALSLTFGRRRGILWGWLTHRADSARADRLDLLRAIFEALEAQGAVRKPASGEAGPLKAIISESQLEPFRTWPARRLERALKRAAREGLLTDVGPGEFGVTDSAWEEASRVARNHRLWELYLIRYADVAPALVDRNADRIEHVLDPAILKELESALPRKIPTTVPATPHSIPG